MFVQHFPGGPDPTNGMPPLRKSGAMPLLNQPQAQALRRQRSSVAGALYQRKKKNVLASLNDDQCVASLRARLSPMHHIREPTFALQRAAAKAVLHSEHAL